MQGWARTPPQGNSAEESKVCTFCWQKSWKRRRRARSAVRWRPMEVTESDLEAQRSTKAKSGFKGVTVTTSRKFQARIFIKTGLPQLDLGTFDTAEEAARVVAAAKAKRKRGEEPRNEPVRERAARGTVRCASAPALTLNA